MARCHAFTAAGIDTIALDPTRDPRWKATLQFRDQKEFLRAYWASSQCAVFIDEGSKSIGRYNAAMEETATLGRHRGHINHYIMQRAIQVPLTLRDQCTELFLFSASHKDGAAMADDFGFDELRDCNSLKKGEYFHASLETKTCRRLMLWRNKNASTNSGNRSRSSGNRNDDATAEAGNESEENSGNHESQA